MNSPRQPPEQQPPPVQRLRVRYAKLGRARFASHRDFGRAFERALRRADVPMAYSSGFNPHPRISYANASPTGAATHAEYLEIGLARRCDPDALRAALSEALPTGLDVLEVVEASGPGLMDRLTASVWEMSIDGPSREVTERAVAALLAAERVEVSRQAKSGLRSFDVRAAVIGLRVVDDATLVLVVRHEVPLVRPDDVLAAMAQVESGFGLSGPALLTRLEQGEWRGGRIVGPFESRS